MRNIVKYSIALALAASSNALNAQDASAPEAPVPNAADPDAPAPKMVMTPSGSQFVPVPGWALDRREGMLAFTAPEGDATLALVEVDAPTDARDAIGQAWSAFAPDFAREIELLQEPPARSGWDYIAAASYRTSPAEQQLVQAIVFRKDDAWTVALLQGAIATFAKRAAQLNQTLATITPVDFERESFVGRQANALTADRVAELKDFLQRAMTALDVPGVGIALIGGGEIAWEGGLGVTDLGTGEQVDENTRFMIASNTKGMTTLLLADLVDDGLLAWDRKVTEAYPGFQLGSPETSEKVRIEHLICACTGLPRKDLQFVFNTRADTPASDTFAQLAATEPTSGFGEVFQYNNLMASAAGYIAGNILYPEMEIGAAYDLAMEERVFGPLGMGATTFDHAEAMADNWARPYARGFGGTLQPVLVEWNRMIAPFRPAGGAWSTAHDMALYVLNEIRVGRMQDGVPLLSSASLLKRRQRYVPMGDDAWYGMGLMEDASTGKAIFNHGGSLLGYKSDFWFVPEDGVGAVLLTNSDSGQALLSLFKRRLLEVLYDGNAEAEENLAAAVRLSEAAREKSYARINASGDPSVLARLASRYVSEELGALIITNSGEETWAEFASGRSTIGTRENDDGSYSIVLTSPGLFGSAFVIGERDGKGILRVLDAQHEYVFVESGS